MYPERKKKKYSALKTNNSHIVQYAGIRLRLKTIVIIANIKVFLRAVLFLLCGEENALSSDNLWCFLISRSFWCLYLIRASGNLRVNLYWSIWRGDFGSTLWRHLRWTSSGRWCACGVQIFERCLVKSNCDVSFLTVWMGAEVAGCILLVGHGCLQGMPVQLCATFTVYFFPYRPWHIFMQGISKHSTVVPLFDVPVITFTIWEPLSSARQFDELAEIILPCRRLFIAGHLVWSDLWEKLNFEDFMIRLLFTFCLSHIFGEKHSCWCLWI